MTTKSKLTDAQFRMLDYLERSGHATTSTIARVLYRSGANGGHNAIPAYGAATTVLRNLEGKGLIKSEVRGRDMDRYERWTLTKRGRDALEEARTS